jgi:hypothetical protein
MLALQANSPSFRPLTFIEKFHVHNTERHRKQISRSLIKTTQVPPTEALAAVSLVGNIVQFVDVGAKIIKTAREINNSKHGRTKELTSLEVSTGELRQLSRRLDVSRGDLETDDQRALRRLAQECQDLSEQLLGLIRDVAPAQTKS